MHALVSGIHWQCEITDHRLRDVVVIHLHGQRYKEYAAKNHLGFLRPGLSSNPLQVFDLIRFRTGTKDEMRFSLRYFKDRLGKDAVGPREPAACILTIVVHMDAFVDKAKMTNIPDKVDGFDDFFIRIGSA